MDFSVSAEDREFGRELRAWVDANLPEDWTIRREFAGDRTRMTQARREAGYREQLER